MLRLLGIPLPSILSLSTPLLFPDSENSPENSDMHVCREKKNQTIVTVPLYILMRCFGEQRSSYPSLVDL